MDWDQWLNWQVSARLPAFEAAVIRKVLRPRHPAHLSEWTGQKGKEMKTSIITCCLDEASEQRQEVHRDTLGQTTDRQRRRTGGGG